MFLAILLALGLVWQGTIQFGGFHADLLLPIAILASITDGWILSALTGLVWAFSRTSLMPFLLISIVNISTTLIAKLSYNYARRTWSYSKHCPYYSLMLSAVVHMGLYALLASYRLGEHIACLTICDAAIALGVEIGFGIIIVALILRKLRQHHILNGIKERNMASAQKERL